MTAQPKPADWAVKLAEELYVATQAARYSFTQEQLETPLFHAAARLIEETCYERWVLERGGRLVAAEAEIARLRAQLAEARATKDVHKERQEEYLKLAQQAEDRAKRAETERDDARNLSAEVALGITHSMDCRPETLCCRCRMETAEAEAKSLRGQVAEAQALHLQHCAYGSHHCKEIGEPKTFSFKERAEQAAAKLAEWQGWAQYGRVVVRLAEANRLLARVYELAEDHRCERGHSPQLSQMSCLIEAHLAACRGEKEKR